MRDRKPLSNFILRIAKSANPVVLPTPPEGTINNVVFIIHHHNPRLAVVIKGNKVLKKGDVIDRFADPVERDRII